MSQERSKENPVEPDDGRILYLPRGLLDADRARLRCLGRTGVALLDDGTVSHDIAHIGQKDSRECE